MAVPTSKAELLAAIDKTYSELSRDLDRIPAEFVDEPILPGHVAGTMMSPNDVLSYLIGWNEQVLTWHMRRAANLPDEFPAPGIAWNELGKLAQLYYAEFGEIPYVERRGRLQSAKDALVALIEKNSNEQLYGEPWYGKWTMGRMISLNTSSPYSNARRRIRAGLSSVVSPSS